MNIPKFVLKMLDIHFTQNVTSEKYCRYVHSPFHAALVNFASRSYGGQDPVARSCRKKATSIL